MGWILHRSRRARPPKRVERCKPRTPEEPTRRRTSGDAEPGSPRPLIVLRAKRHCGPPSGRPPNENVAPAVRATHLYISAPPVFPLVLPLTVLPFFVAVPPGGF